MQGKPPVFVSSPAGHAIDQFSKSTLIDFICDLARAELGEPASDRQVLQWIERRIEPTLIARKCKMPRLHECAQRYFKVMKEFADKKGFCVVLDDDNYSIRC